MSLPEGLPKWLVSAMEIEIFDPRSFSARRTRLDVEQKLKSDPEGEQLLTEALEIAIQHGGNLDTLRRKVPDRAKLEQIISFFNLESKANRVESVTMGRLQACFPERAMEVAHRIKPRLLSRATPEAFPYAMRNDGLGTLLRVPQDRDLMEAYSLYKAQKAAAFDSLERDIVDCAKLGTQMKFVMKAGYAEKGLERVIFNRKYGIYKEDGQLVDVLRDMAAEYRRIMGA